MKKYINFLKPMLLVLILNAFLYFITKQLNLNYNFITPKITFPFIPTLVFIYNSWYPFIFIISFIIYKKDYNLFRKLIKSLIISIILSNLTFIIYPTIINRPSIKVDNITSFILNLTYKIDNPAVNCLPSIHCLFSFIISYYILKTKSNIKTKTLILIYFLLIILSTLLFIQLFS